MGGAEIALAKERDIWDGIFIDGFTSGKRTISYYQLESVLLEFPQVLEAGVVAKADDETGCQILNIYLALEECAVDDKDYEQFTQEVIQYIRDHFSLQCPISVNIKDKLPMTRSGKILRTVLESWT
jgi:acyl-coenzyme A synthetase/AMP-(fatty) acid ligase